MVAIAVGRAGRGAILGHATAAGRAMPRRVRVEPRPPEHGRRLARAAVGRLAELRRRRLGGAVAGAPRGYSESRTFLEAVRDALPVDDKGAQQALSPSALKIENH